MILKPLEDLQLSITPSNGTIINTTTRSISRTWLPKSPGNSSRTSHKPNFPPTTPTSPMMRLRSLSSMNCCRISSHAARSCIGSKPSTMWVRVCSQTLFRSSLLTGSGASRTHGQPRNSHWLGKASLYLPGRTGHLIYCSHRCTGQSKSMGCCSWMKKRQSYILGWITWWYNRVRWWWGQETLLSKGKLGSHCLEGRMLLGMSLIRGSLKVAINCSLISVNLGCSE